MNQKRRLLISTMDIRIVRDREGWVLAKIQVATSNPRRKSTIFCGEFVNAAIDANTTLRLNGIGSGLGTVYTKQLCLTLTGGGCQSKTNTKHTDDAPCLCKFRSYPTPQRRAMNGVVIDPSEEQEVPSVDSYKLLVSKFDRYLHSSLKL
jgi:hypothetical protein